MNIMRNMAMDAVRKESAILDREMHYFLRSHGLPPDREKIEELGFEVLMETVMPPEPMGTTRYIFKLAKIVDRKEIRVKHNLKII